jgi:hypothetical protein
MRETAAEIFGLPYGCGQEDSALAIPQRTTRLTDELKTLRRSFWLKKNLERSETSRCKLTPLSIKSRELVQVWGISINRTVYWYEKKSTGHHSIISEKKV